LLTILIKSPTFEQLILFPECQYDVMSAANRSITVLFLVGMLIQLNCVFVCYGLFLRA